MPDFARAYHSLAIEWYAVRFHNRCSISYQILFYCMRYMKHMFIGESSHEAKKLEMIISYQKVKKYSSIDTINYTSVW